MTKTRGTKHTSTNENIFYYLSSVCRRFLESKSKTAIWDLSAVKYYYTVVLGFQTYYYQHGINNVSYKPTRKKKNIYRS